ncbi:kelch motif domain-containing protein [Ditylenchus destructor]|nr:kelch motif domain-containing protein [Ditylenchus destructor]
METSLECNNNAGYDDRLLDTTQCSDNESDCLPIRDENDAPSIEETAQLTMQLMKNNALAGIVNSLPYTDVSEDLWLQHDHIMEDRAIKSEMSNSLDESHAVWAIGSKARKTYYFENHNAMLTTLDDCEIGFNVQFLSQFSDFVKSIFCHPGDNYIEKRSRRIHLQMFCFEPVLATLVLLSNISTKSSREVDSQSDLDWMSLKSAIRILDLATFLQIEVIQCVVSDLICRKVTENSLVDVYKYAEMRYLPLAERLWDVIVKDFNLLIENNKFLEFCADHLVALLKDPGLNIRPEKECPLIYDWLQHNRPVCEEHEIIDLEQALERASMTSNSKQGAGFVARPRLPQSIILAVGGWGTGGPADYLDVYEPNRRCWMTVQKESLFSAGMSNRAYHATVVDEDSLYILGGYDGANYHNATQKLNLSTLKWSTIAPMNERRCYISATLLKRNYIMSVGGFNNSIRLSSTEILNMSRNQWTPASSMTHVRSDGHCVAIDELCYAVGGFDGAFCHNTCEFYDANRDQWILLEKPMRHNRSGVKAVVMGRVLVAIGGFTGETRLRTAEYYDPREGLWHQLASMSLARSNFGIETIGSTIVVCGGYTEVSTTNACEVFDWRANSWSAMPQLPLRRSALAVSRIDCHKVIEEMVNEHDLGLPFSYL